MNVARSTIRRSMTVLTIFRSLSQNPLSSLHKPLSFRCNSKVNPKNACDTNSLEAGNSDVSEDRGEWFNFFTKDKSTNREKENT